MIALLTGLLALKAPSQVTLDVHGVGYEVLIPLSTYYSLPNLHELVTLNIHTHVREDAIQLYGFLTQAEKEAFLLLTGISATVRFRLSDVISINTAVPPGPYPSSVNSS